MHEIADIQISARGLRVAVITSRYHLEVTEPLRAAAERVFLDAGGDAARLRMVWAPGAFELTAVCTAALRSGAYDAVVALGCIIRGETTHDQHLAGAIAHGLTHLTLTTGIPVAFGVLTCQTLHQARARAGGSSGNKGEEAMRAALDAVHAIRAFEGANPT